MLRSLVSYIDRGPFGDADFRGNASGWLLVQLIHHFTPKVVYDPMEGSATSHDVCKGMNIEYIGNDLLGGGYDLVSCELEQIPTNDLTYFHPPYHNIIKYSDHPNDLSNQETYEEYLKKLRICIDKLLKKTKILTVLIGDIARIEETRFIAFDLYEYYKARVIQRVIKAQHSVGSGFADVALKEKNPYYIPLRHEDVLLLKGDNF